MKTRVENVPVYETVKIKKGIKKKIYFITDDNKEFETKVLAEKYVAEIKKRKEYINACDRMRVKLIKGKDDSYVILKTTTIEDLNIYESYNSKHVKETSNKYFKPNIWVIVEK